MNPVVRRTLGELIARFGAGLCEEPQRLEAMLRDLCGEHRREIFVLVAALKERVAQELRAPGTAPRELVVLRLTERLVEGLALTEAAARWAVDSWALALGVMSAEELARVGSAAAETAGTATTPPAHGAAAPAEVAATMAPGTAAPETPGSPRVPALPGSGDVLVSPAGRGQFPTISRALRAAPPEARILVEPGRYLEALILDRAVELVGLGERGAVVIESSTADALVCLAEAATVRNLALWVRGGERGRELAGVEALGRALVLEDCDIRSDGRAAVAVHGPAASVLLHRCRLHDAPHAGLLAYERGQARLEDCEIGDCAVGLVAQSGARFVLHGGRVRGGEIGLYVEDAAGEVEDGVLFGQGVAALRVRRGGAPVLRRVRIRDSRALGVLVEDGGRGLLEGCDIFGCAQAGVAIVRGGDPELRGCVIHDGAAEGIHVYAGGRGLLEDCEVLGQARAGVRISESSFPILRRCRVHGQHGAGVLVDSGGQGLLEGCELSDNGGAGLESIDRGDPVVRACRIERNASYGVFAHAGGGGSVEASSFGGNQLGALCREGSSSLRLDGRAV